jgi:hypothetical protein
MWPSGTAGELRPLIRCTRVAVVVALEILQGITPPAYPLNQSERAVILLGLHMRLSLLFLHSSRTLVREWQAHQSTMR